MTVFLFRFVCYRRQHITPALLLDNKEQISKLTHTHIRIKDKVIKQVFSMRIRWFYPEGEKLSAVHTTVRIQQKSLISTHCD